MHFKNRDIVSIDQFSKDEITYLLSSAQTFKTLRQNNLPLQHLLRDRRLGYAFFEPSTRTRLSFLAAAQNQGMHRLGFGSAEATSLTKNESTHHTLEMLSQFGCDAIVLRHGSDGAAQYAADLLDVPIINAGDGKHEHPTQTLIDLFSILETQGRLDNLAIALVGDLKYGRTVHSLIKALRRYRSNRFLLVHPPALSLPAEYTPKNCGDCTGATLEDAVRTADIAYITRVQAERIPDERERREALGRLQLKSSMLSRARPNLKVLHPLPVDAHNPEIEPALYKECREHAYFFTQAGNGVPVREALLCAVLGKTGSDFKGEPYTPPSYAEGSMLNRAHGWNADARPAKKELTYVYRIDKGVVIDHIPHGLGKRLYDTLQLARDSGTTILVHGLDSGKTKKKDLLKLVGRELTLDELNTVAIICPEATVNIIEDTAIVNKGKVQLAGKIIGLLECQNNGCITHSSRDTAPSIFYAKSAKPALLSCHYCDTLHSLEQGNIKIAIK